MFNPVAKNAHKFNKPKVEKSKKSYTRKCKHGGKRIDATL
jgi:hypothetical protein